MSELFKCQECGTELQFNKGDTYCECPACFTKQILPKNTDNRILSLYETAELHRTNNDFDRAKTAYEKIIDEDKTDAEAHWSYLLCKYGIEYVDDPNGQGKKPTIHRIQRVSILKDDDYKAVLSNASDEQKLIFEEKAKEIALIQDKFLEISKNEKPYDIFICFKQTNEKGKNTMDSVIAEEIYDNLTENGYKVFFSKITLQGKLGVEYEPYIFAALTSAKVMLVVGTRPDYLESAWVKNEWTRYLEFVNAGENKAIIPVYDSMKPADFSEKLQGKQGIEWQLGADKTLLKNINELFGRNKGQVAVADTPEAKLANCYNRAKLALENHEWKDADKFAEDALTLNSEYAPAYLIKLLAKCGCFTLETLHKSQYDFGQYSEYKNYFRFSQNQDEKKLVAAEYEEWLRLRDEAARERLYDDANNALKANTKESLKIAISEFDSLDDYKDSKELYLKSVNKLKALKVKKTIKTLIVLTIIIAPIVAICTYAFVIAPSKLYDKAIELVDSGRYDDAYDLLDELKAEPLYKNKIEAIEKDIKFREAQDILESGGEYKKAYAMLDSLGDYNGADTFLADDRFERAKKLLNTGDFENAYELLEECGDYNGAKELLYDSKYDRGMEYYNNAQYVMAYRMLADMNGYKDSDRIVTEIDGMEVPSLIIYKQSLISDEISFGSYEQDGDAENGAEPIEWIIVENGDTEVTLLSKYVIDARPYSLDASVYTTWENAPIRYWLNGDFYNAAFSAEDKSIMMASEVDNQNEYYESNDKYKLEGLEDGNSPDKGVVNTGSNTMDYIYLPSYGEFFSYFPDGKDDRARGITTASVLNRCRDEKGFSNWHWEDGDIDYLSFRLRTATRSDWGGGKTQHFVVIGSEANTRCSSFNSDEGYCGVRPVIKLDLSAGVILPEEEIVEE